MVGNIILYFSTLASAFRFKAPLPPYLPPAEKARQQLVGRYLFIFEPHSQRDVLCTGDRYPKSERCEEP